MSNCVNYSFDNLTIQLSDEPTDTSGADNEIVYALHYFTDGPQDRKGCMHGIRLFKNELEINSCLLIGSSGTTVHPTSALINDRSLLICCGDSVFSLMLPSLELNW